MALNSITLTRLMPRRILKRLLPDHRTIKEHKHLKFFGALLHDPNLWHLNRRSVPGAVSVGLFVAFLPFPFQMVLAAALAILLRVNFPISVVLVWITNPVTMPAMYYFAYKAGAWLLDEPTRQIKFELTFDWLTSELGSVGGPLLLGCVIMGTISAALGNLLIRGFWRFHVLRSWQSRKIRRTGDR